MPDGPNVNNNSVLAPQPHDLQQLILTTRYAYDSQSPLQQQLAEQIGRDVTAAAFDSFQQYGYEIISDELTTGQMRIYNHTIGLEANSPYAQDFPGVIDMHHHDRSQPGSYFVGVYRGQNTRPLIIGAGWMHQDSTNRPNPSAFYIEFENDHACQKFLDIFQKQPTRALEYYLQTKLKKNIPGPQDSLQPRDNKSVYPFGDNGITTLTFIDHTQLVKADDKSFSIDIRQQTTPTIETSIMVPPRASPEITAATNLELEIEAIAKACQRAECHIFQLIDYPLVKRDGQFIVDGPTNGFFNRGASGAFGSEAIKKNLQFKIRSVDENAFLARDSSLHDIFGNAHDTKKFPRVGIAFIVLEKTELGKQRIIIYGNLAGDHNRPTGSQASNLFFDFDEEASVTTFLRVLSTTAKAYEAGTAANADVLQKVMKKIFPEEALQTINARWYSRLEIFKILDLRR